MGQEVSFLTGVALAFKKSPAGILIGVLLLYGVFATTNWQNAETALRKCKDDETERERANSNEKALFLKGQNETWLELGRLRQQVEFYKQGK